MVCERVPAHVKDLSDAAGRSPELPSAAWEHRAEDEERKTHLPLSLWLLSGSTLSKQSAFTPRVRDIHTNDRHADFTGGGRFRDDLPDGDSFPWRWFSPSSDSRQWKNIFLKSPLLVFTVIIDSLLLLPCWATDLGILDDYFYFYYFFFYFGLNLVECFIETEENQSKPLLRCSQI